MSNVTAWTWAFPKTSPSLLLALHIGAAVRQALFDQHKRLGYDAFPPDFHGPSASGNHQHASFFSEDTDEDGLVDRVTLYAPLGITPTILAAAALVSSIEVCGAQYKLEPEAMGDEQSVLLARPARFWRSITPFVTSRHRLSKNGKERPAYAPERQFEDELYARGLNPSEHAFESAAYLGQRIVTPDAFAIGGEARRPSRPPPTDAVSAFAALTFETPVRGPIALGYGSHFGLGLFMPVAL